MTAEFKDLKKQFVEIKAKDSRAVSYSNYYDEKLGEDRIEVWTPKLKDTKVRLPDYLQIATQNTGSEKTRVKPFWSGLLKRHTIAPKFQCAYEAAYLGPKIPDIAIFSKGVTTPLASDFVAAGDCKGDTWTGRSSTEKGQIMLYLHRMLDAQPIRQFGYGFVTNNHSLVLVKGYRGQDAPFIVRWCISSVLNFNYGMKLWLQLMREDTGYRSPPVVGNFPVTLKDTLRPGGTCRAFLASYRGKSVVAKLYDSEEVADENAALTKRAAAVVAQADGTRFAAIPEVVVTGEKWCLISPKGTPLTRENFAKVHVENLVNTLQVIHEAGIIHRDVRVSNIFCLDEKQVLLNDWGSSATIGGEPFSYAGAPEPHIHPQIPLADMYDPAAKHDLYAMVSSVAQLLAPGVNIEARRLMFKEAFDAAEDCEYADVASKLMGYMIY
jgi:Protein kinase domain